jgi:hypothetical protein
MPSLPPRPRLPHLRRPSWLGRVRPEIVLAGLVGLAVVAVVAVAVLSGDGFDRQAALQRVVDDSGGRITPDQAGCYVDRVHAEVGDRYLSSSVRPPDDVVSRLTAIRVDCVGVANLGVAGTVPAMSGTDVPSTESGNLPRRVGDDPVLDQLYRDCGAGVGQACDQLFAAAPVGSDYESFAVTCGNRTRELSCAAVYVGPGVTNPPTTPSTPAP